MSSNNPRPGTETYWEDLEEQAEEKIEEMVEDETIDFDANKRQPEGWLGTYVECPNCQTPLARVQGKVKGDSITTQEGADLARSRQHEIGVCPDCHEVQAAIQVVKLQGEVDDFPEEDDPAWTWWFEGADQ